MTDQNLNTRARELTDEQLRWVQDDLALDGCPLCGAEACLEACEALADRIDAHVRKLAAGLSPTQVEWLGKLIRRGQATSPRHVYGPNAGGTRRVLDVYGLIVTGTRENSCRDEPTPLGRAVLRVLEEQL